MYAGAKNNLKGENIPKKVVSGLAMLLQAGIIFYAGNMLRWYFSMASRNMHAIEESIAGTTYCRSEFFKIK